MSHDLWRFCAKKQGDAKHITVYKTSIANKHLTVYKTAIANKQSPVENTENINSAAAISMWNSDNSYHVIHEHMVHNDPTRLEKRALEMAIFICDFLLGVNMECVAWYEWYES